MRTQEEAETQGAIKIYGVGSAAFDTAREAGEVAGEAILRVTLGEVEEGAG